MALAQQIRQRQAQAVTPAMMMGFSLLQLPIGELKESVQKELASNPALEVDLPRGRVSAPLASSEDMSFLENKPDERAETLDEHILSEMRMRPGVTARELKIAEALAENLDRDGRFTGAYADLVMVLSGRGVAHVTEGELEGVRKILLSLDPKGCAARDLAECYLAQLEDLPAAQRASAAEAVKELAGAIRSGGLEKFRPSDPKSFLLLKKLNPFPGRLYELARVTVVTPDVFADAEGNIRLETGDIPALRVSAKYVEMAKDRDLDEETRAYAAERVKRAREFHEALIRRRETMETIAQVVMERQKCFLKKGPSSLVKLTMSEVAREAKCAVSTVSRAAARKYVKTPGGVFPLRKFFAAVDAAPVEKLREIISSVPEGKHLSDRELSERMAKAGYPMARRTVAKYRARLEGR